MNTRDLFHETTLSLSSNLPRSALTVLGIVIGIAAVIAMLAIGNGAKASIQSSIESLGANLLTIFPGVVQPGRGIVSSGRGAAQTLKSPDVDIIKSIDGISFVSPENQRRFQVVSSVGNNTNTTVTGGTAAYQNIHNLNVVDGNFFNDEADRSLKRQAVLGATLASDLFADDEPVGKPVRVNGALFTVIGVLEKKGGFGFSGPDDMLIVPLSVMQKVLTGADYFSIITVSVTDKSQMNNIRDQITSALLAKHRVSEPDFSIISQEDILGTLSTVVNTFTLFLASIAGISLLVGGIGIMNMMLTTVTERTKEIGLRKAVGAKSRDINQQFLAEAVLLTFFGGVIGIIIGWLISISVTSFGIVRAEVSLFSVILSFGVSALIGIIFGYYPARRAANLNPIEALRYE